MPTPISLCTVGHADLKNDVAKLLEATVPQGIQRDRKGEPLHILRNCRRCGSTLCIDPDLAPELIASDA